MRVSVYRQNDYYEFCFFSLRAEKRLKSHYSGFFRVQNYLPVYVFECLSQPGGCDSLHFIPRIYVHHCRSAYISSSQHTVHMLHVNQRWAEYLNSRVDQKKTVQSLMHRHSTTVCRHPRFGGNSKYWGKMMAGLGLCPSVVQKESPWSQDLGKAPSPSPKKEAGSFLLRKYC